MPSIPKTPGILTLAEGPFTAADVIALTGLTPAALQHWTNKGYLGKDKVGLGKGARRVYSAAETEIIAIAKELTDCGALPKIAVELAALIVSKTETLLEEQLVGTITDATSAAEITARLEQIVPKLIATVRMNAKPGDGSAVQILSGGKYTISDMFPDCRPAIMVPIGMVKLTLGQMLQQVELSKPTQRRTTPKPARKKGARR